MLCGGQKTILYVTPLLIYVRKMKLNRVAGNNPLTAKMFMIAVDQVIIHDQLPIFKNAFQMMFCSYYLHNIDYPVEIGATLEFLQRCMFKINPDQGTKVSRKEKGRQYTMNPRVLSLISKIANFEWTE
ncbi:hypothetical protein IRJ41_018610 [Triplophysa rosa]|uniref:Uncharacterized protein n=1 Tax=Triplophysa rosa TaxID=992332 RepID=A0A9W7X409_TRIRA|nr:hypothetical protein IRJ41_018610 [Triplophysa rosa]